MCKNQDVICRNMTVEDLEQVEHLERICFSDAWSEKLLRDSLESRWDTLFVAEYQGQAVQEL